MTQLFLISYMSRKSFFVVVVILLITKRLTVVIEDFLRNSFDMTIHENIPYIRNTFNDTNFLYKRINNIVNQIIYVGTFITPLTALICNPFQLQFLYFQLKCHAYFINSRSKRCVPFDVIFIQLSRFEG